MCLVGETSVIVKYAKQPGLRGYVLAHELGHFFGFPHTKGQGIMSGNQPPDALLADKPATGDFTPSQIKMMKVNIPKFALNPEKPKAVPAGAGQP